MDGRTDNRNRSRSPRAGRQKPSSARTRPTQAEITRNRIIAVVVLVVLVVLLANLVMCAARTLGGSEASGGSGATAGSVGSGTAASAPSGASASTSVVAIVAQQAAQQTAAAAEAAEADEADEAAETDETSEAAEVTSTPLVAMALQQVRSKMADTTYRGVEDPWVPGGLFTTGDRALDQLVKDYCDSDTVEGASASENARTVFSHCTWADFEERENNQHPEGPTWDIEYAKQFFDDISGNCYEVAAAAEFVVKYFGYTEAYAEPCFILRQSGEYGDHGLLYVTDLDGRKCLCDVAFGTNGWMLDADIYTVKLMDIGQDPSEFTIADFEEVVPAPWMSA